MMQSAIYNYAALLLTMGRELDHILATLREKIEKLHKIGGQTLTINY